VPGVVQPDDAEAGAGDEDVVGLAPPLPRLGACNCLPHPVPAKGRAGSGERTAAAIRVVVTEDATTAPGLLADMEDAVVEVEVRPAETDDLAPAEAHGDREHDCTTARRDHSCHTDDN